MPAPSIFKLPWPRGGFVEDSPRAQQPEGTTTDCLNVRNYDSLERRNRGGKRSGLSKLAEDAVNSTNSIQELTQVTEALDLVQSAAWSDAYAVPTFNSTNNCNVEWSPDGTLIAVRENAGSGDVVTMFSVSGTVVSTTGHSIDFSDLPGVCNHMVWHPSGSHIFCVGADGSNSYVVAFPYDTSTGFGTRVDAGSEPTSASAYSVAVTPDGNAVIVHTSATPYLHAWVWSGTAFGSKYSAPGTVPFSGTPAQARNGLATVAVNEDGDTVFVTDNDELEAYPWSNSTGFGTKYTSPATVTNSGATITAGIDVRTGTTHVIRGATGTSEVIAFDKITGWGTRSTSSTGALATPRFHPDGDFVLGTTTGADRADVFPFASSLGTRLTASSGVTSLSSVYDGAWNSTGTAIALTPNDATTGLAVFEFQNDAINAASRETRLIAVSGGSVYRSSLDFGTFSVVASGSAALSASAPYIDSALAFQKLFFCDGQSANYQYLDFADNTLKDWASAVTAGTLPQGSTDTTLGCRIICNYRGRVVLSGLKEDPQNWFMAAKDDPFDWDYSPATTTATQAVAGNNADAGLMGDIITGLFPYKDDLLVMGGANEINIMSGDPADGGAIDNLSQNIGIVGPHAGCFDTVGNFYFFGVNGLYRVSAGLGSQPQLVSQGRLDRVFSDLDVSANDIRLEYDAFWQGVHIFIVPIAQPATGAIQFFYDERNDCFWRDQYPAAVGPTATTYLSADNPENSGLIVGGYDSFVRRFDPDSLTDDGTAISSFIRFTPLAAGDIFASSRIDDMTFLLDKGSGPTTLKLFAGDTVEDAEDQADADTARFKRTVVGGRNTPFRPRVSQNAFVVELSHDLEDSTFAFEDAGGRISVLNRMKGRRV